MRRGGLVKSVRGPGGGYRLALPADQISIGMVISAVMRTLMSQDALEREIVKVGLNV